MKYGIVYYRVKNEFFYNGNRLQYGSSILVKEKCIIVNRFIIMSISGPVVKTFLIKKSSRLEDYIMRNCEELLAVEGD